MTINLIIFCELCLYPALLFRHPLHALVYGTLYSIGVFGLDQDMDLIFDWANDGKWRALWARPMAQRERCLPHFDCE